MPLRFLKTSDALPWGEVRFQIHYPKSGGKKTKIYGFLEPVCDNEGVDFIETFLSSAEDDEEAVQRCYLEIISHADECGYGELAVPFFPDEKHTGLSREEILYAASSAYLEAVSETETLKTVYLIDDSFTPEEESILSIADYISRTYVEPDLPFERYSITNESEDMWLESHVLFSKKPDRDDDQLQDDDLIPEVGQTIISYSADYAPFPVLPAEDQTTRFDPVRGFFHMDESFGETVLRLIREKGLTDSQCYNKANITRAAFYKIRQSARDPESTYRPSKQTALALAVALELNLEEATDLLERAGYAFSHSNKGDIIVEYFLLNHKYNLFELNEVLLRYDQPLLGSMM